MAEEASGDQGGKLELMCSRVGYAEKPSSAASVLADRGTLHPPQVSFLRGGGEERNLACVVLVPLSLLISVSTAFVPGRCECASVADGVFPRTAAGEHCGAGVCS
jgi:hypothetical protein